MKRMTNGKRAGLWVLAAVLVCSLALGGFALASGDRPTVSDEEIDQIINTTTDASKVESPFLSVANSVRNSVVGVKNYQRVRPSSYDYYFGFGFGGRNNGRDQQQATEQLYATGSGVAVTKYGHVLTNYHVIENASRVTVTVEGDDKEYEANIVTYDVNQDIAVLLVEGLPVEPVVLGDSDALQVGEWAIVIGNPLSETFARTVTIGVISALNRQIVDTSYDRFNLRTKNVNYMIQVDAAINSGNSGGGMFNTLGQLMGIPERKYSTGLFSGADVDNIGMCIPINLAKPLIREALQKYNSGTDVTASRTGENQTSPDGSRPLLGVRVTTVSGANAVLPDGALVISVEEDSNASRAGIQAGDVIVSVDDTVISSSNALVSCIQNYNEGAELKIRIYRAPGMADAIQTDRIDLSTVGEGEYIDLTVTLLGSAAA